MLMTAAAIAAPAAPRQLARTAVLVVGFTLATALAAQLRVPLWFTPVPMTGQSFVVLLAGVSLGWRAGAASQALYLLLGASGLPFFSGTHSGWEVLTGATGGYLFGFVAAAAVAGLLAEAQPARRTTGTIKALLAGNAVVYLVGVPWLAAVTGSGIVTALHQGFLPFVAGDLLKVALAALALPAAARLSGRRNWETLP
jgi:biotin transport system substrate-specific component